MEKNKKSRLFTLMSILLVFTLLSVCLMSGTLSKYVSTFSGADSARVAIWDFNGINTLEIFETAYDNTVTSSNSDMIIAPGTANSFLFEFESGTSEVDSKIIFSNIEEVNEDEVPIVYEVDGNYYSNMLTGAVYLKFPDDTHFTPVDIKGNLEAMARALSNDTDGYATVSAGGNYDDIPGKTITWHWAFEEDASDKNGNDIRDRDVKDTKLGVDSIAEVSLKIDITAEQVD